MNDLLQRLPPDAVGFVLTALFAFVIGLELHSYRRAAGEPLAFGTTRTLTLIAVFGFALIDLGGWTAYLVGLVVVGAWLALFYRQRLKQGHEHLLALLVAISAYLLGPLSLQPPLWKLVAFTAVVLLMLGAKPGIRRFSDAFRSDEAVTVAKFLIMAGLVLPLLPDRAIAAAVPVTWVQVWMAVVVVSGLSYLSYLAQTYFFPTRGVLLTGVLGGLYSSTAATVVLARRAGEARQPQPLTGAAIVLATAMMYLRLWLLIAVLGSFEAALRLTLPFTVLALGSGAVAWWLARRASPASDSEPPRVQHPLEFSTAALFATLFVVFAALTQAVIGHFGDRGLQWLSFLTGLTDIDPFVLSLLSGHFALGAGALQAAVLIASGSNNLLKAGYALALSRKRELVPAAGWLVVSFLVSLGWAWVVVG